MIVRWSEDAERDRSNIFDFIAVEDPRAAERMDAMFGEAADRLARFPAMGREGSVSGTREWLPHRRYRRVYEVADDNTVLILAFVHTSRQWPPIAD